MSEVFNTYKLSEVTNIFAGGDLPDSFSTEKTDMLTIPVFSNGEKNNGLYGYTNTPKVTEPAVTISARGSKVGFAAIRKEPFFPIVRLLSLIPYRDRLDVDFLFYNLKLNRLNGTGSGQPQITIPDISNRTISVPPLHTQQKIATVLSALDSKISLNNRINAELEAMAKTIYDYWFVQFDFPNKNGKPYKASGGKMLWSEELKREIPEGWEVKELGVICDLYQPQTISENEMNIDGEYFVYGANGIVGRYSKYNHEDSEIVVTCRGNTCGTIARTTPFSWITGNAMVVKSKSKAMSSEFVYYLLHNIGVSRSITGSAQPQITRTNLSPLKAVVPDEITLNRYSEFVASSVKRRLNIFEENQKLTELRDWLLPMLMNGQIKIKDAEHLSAAALAKDEELAKAAEPKISYAKKRA